MQWRFSDEYTGANLGDSRRSDRLVALAESLAVLPGTSFPQALRESAELEAGYRFFNNPAVNPSSILEPHRLESASRCKEHKTVVVAHDTTSFSFSGEREDLGPITGMKSKRGFFAHTALALTFDGQAEPLGVLNLEQWTRIGPRKGTAKISPRDRQKDAGRESRRWARGVDAVETLLGGNSALHVMDREADIYDLFAPMLSAGVRFVIRSNFDRRLADTEEKLREHLFCQPVTIEREVAVTKRKGSVFPKTRKVNPPRNARIATLELKGNQVTLSRPRNLGKEVPRELSVNVVVVEEVDPPKGESPIHWRLYTSEPIDSPLDIERVVDAYRCRWRIEEFFKALKTGCAIQKRQLDSKHALMNAVAVFIPIAWKILRHRTLAQTDSDRPASRAMTKIQVKILRKLSKKKLPRALTVADALVAVAALGGHLKNNGPPGWLTIARGYEDLLMLEKGAILAMEM